MSVSIETIAKRYGRWGMRHWLLLAVLALILAFIGPSAMLLLGREVVVEVINETNSPVLDVQFSFEGGARPLSFGDIAPGQLKKLRVPRTAMIQNRLSYRRSDNEKTIVIRFGYTNEQDRTLEPALRFGIVKDARTAGENNVYFRRRRWWNPEWIIGR
jgi:hypothetical protein